MRRKSARTSGKQSPEKAKLLDSPATKLRRTSRRRRKSTSESENSEDEQEVKRTPEVETSPNGANIKQAPPDVDNNDSLIEKKAEIIEETMEKPDKKIKLKRNRSSGTHDKIQTNAEDKQLSRRSRRRGSPKTEERTHQEDDDEDRKGKGKSKGKTKSAKIEKSQPPNESETHNESDISTNAQVTPQSPQIVNTNLMVDNVVDVAENTEDNKGTEIREQNEGDGTGDTDTKDKNVVCDEGDNLINKTEIESTQNTEDINEKPTDTVVDLCESNTEKITDSSDNSDIKIVESIVSSEETKTEEVTITETEKETETIQTEIIQSEASEENAKSDEDFAGFIQEQPSNNISQPIDESMDISADVTFTLKTEETSLNITEAEEPVQEHETEIPPKETLLPQDPHSSKEVKPPQETLYVPRKIRIRHPSGAKPEDPRDKGWGSTATYYNLFSEYVKIDTEIVQNIYSNVQFLDESEVKLDVVDTKDRRRSITEVKDRKKLERSVSSNDSESRKHDLETEEKEQEKDNANIIAMNRKISIVDDSASKLKPPPSPAKNPVANVLFITNLVRPFTLKQLKELLERTGKIKENCFWTDRIKSKCYVQYENVEDAEATRNALHGVHWPIGNGKKLIIDFATDEDLQNAKNPPVVVPVPEPAVPIEKENEEPVRTVTDEKEDRSKEKLKEKRRHEHVREWDVGKTETRRDRSRSRTRDRADKRKHVRHSPSPFEDYLARKQKKAEDQVPQKLMDDLFQKTKTTPSIYWQPLSPDEIATKQQQRLERMAEHKRRMEESSRNTRADFGRGAPYRRRYD